MLLPALRLAQHGGDIAMMKCRFLLSIAGVLLAMTAAFTVSAQRADQVQVGMTISGWVNINPDGSLDSFGLKDPEKLSVEVLRLLGQTVPGWRFAPVLVDGRPVKARARMHLRLLATRRDDGNYEARIGSAWFGDDIDLGVKPDKRVPARYPRLAQHAGVSGTVYAVLRIGADGRVVDAAAERVDVRLLAPEKALEKLRKMFADATLDACSEWTFSVPQGSAAEGRTTWDVRTVMDFVMEDAQQAGYGEWDSYVPGPYRRAPWLDDSVGAPSDAMMAGGVYPVGTGPRLLTVIDPAG